MDWVREAGASRYFPPLIAELLFSENMYRVQEEVTGERENLFAFVSEEREDGTHVNHTMWHKDDIYMISRHMLDLLRNDKGFLERFIQKFHDICRMHDKQKDGIIPNDIVRMMEEIAGFMMITQPHCVEMIEREVLDRLHDLGPDITPEEILNLLTQPDQISTPTRERIEYYRMLLSGPDGSMIEDHFEKFRVCFLSESSELNKDIDCGWLKSQVEKDLRSVDDIKGRHDAIIRGIDELKDKKRCMIEKLDIPDDLLYMCLALEKFAFYRLESHLLWMVWFLEMSRRLETKAEKLGISRTVMENMRLKEFLDIEDASQLRQDIPEEKVDLFVICIDRKGYHNVYFRDEARAFLKDEGIRLLPPDIDVLEGNTAYPGKVVGKVCLLDESQPLQEQMKKMSDGDIIVAWQTKPNMLPALMRSGAIVTNEGGITSHAAIVSRELKKPCVMMTRWATDVLKDGDLVEVDASSATVRKIR